MHVMRTNRKIGKRCIVEESVNRVIFNNGRFLADTSQSLKAGEWRENGLYYVCEVIGFHADISQQSWSHQTGFMSVV